jgi:hypothetical protein
MQQSSHPSILVYRHARTASGRSAVCWYNVAKVRCAGFYLVLSGNRRAIEMPAYNGSIYWNACRRANAVRSFPLSGRHRLLTMLVSSEVLSGNGESHLLLNHR